MSILGVIPARIGSTRFPEKVIAKIAGKPMIQHVFENAKRAGIFEKLVVATDHKKVAAIVASFGGEAVMTGQHPSGTDRVHEVAQKFPAEIVVNIQGDEPLVRPEMLREMVLPLEQYEHWQMSTLATVQRDEPALKNPNVVKVVFGAGGEALYFSRSVIPFVRDPKRCLGVEVFKHLGFYAYRREALARFCALPIGRLEQTEQLEQLRALENGFKIRVVVTEFDTIAVDVPDDIKKVEEKLKVKI